MSRNRLEPEVVRESEVTAKDKNRRVVDRSAPVPLVPAACLKASKIRLRTPAATAHTMKSVMFQRSFERAARLSAVCVLTAFASTACSHPAPQRQTPAPYVETTMATDGAISPNEALSGIISPYQNVAVQSDLAEPTDSVNVVAGDHVHRGEVIAMLDTADLRATLDADLATAQSDRASTTHNVYQGSLSIAQGVDAVSTAQTAVRQAQANLKRDTIDLARYQSLLEHGYIAEQQVATQQVTVRNDEQTVRSDLAQLASARSQVQANGTLQSNGLQASTVAQSQATEKVALAQAQQERVQIAKAAIISPIDGVVVNRNLNPGEYPGTRQIFTIQQVDPVYAVLHGSGQQIAAIQTGTRANVTASDIHNGRFTGTVQGVLNQISPGSTDFQVMVVLRNPRGQLRPGMAVLGNVTLPSIRGVRVPVTAFTDDNHDAVMTVASGTVKTASVSEVDNDGKTAIVTGLRSGTRVITDGQTSVGDGEKVAIR